MYNILYCADNTQEISNWKRNKRNTCNSMSFLNCFAHNVTGGQRFAKSLIKRITEHSHNDIRPGIGSSNPIKNQGETFIIKLPRILKNF